MVSTTCVPHFFLQLHTKEDLSTKSQYSKRTTTNNDAVKYEARGTNQQLKSGRV